MPTDPVVVDAEQALAEPRGAFSALLSRGHEFLVTCDMLGRWYADSGMFGCANESQGKMLAFLSLAKRMSPDQIIQNFNIIRNRLSKRPEAMLVDFRKAGGKYKWIKDGSDGEAVIELTYQEFKDFRVRYGMDDATRAKLCGPKSERREGQKDDGGWQKNPQELLRARVVARGMRMVAPEVASGLYTPEEIEDMVDEQRALPEPKAVRSDAQVEKISAALPALPMGTMPPTLPPAADARMVPAPVVNAPEINPPKIHPDNQPENGVSSDEVRKPVLTHELARACLADLTVATPNVDVQEMKRAFVEAFGGKSVADIPEDRLPGMVVSVLARWDGTVKKEYTRNLQVAKEIVRLEIAEDAGKAGDE